MTTSIPDSETRQFERAVILVTSLGHVICHLGMTILGGVFFAIAAELHAGPDYVTAIAFPGVALMGIGAIPVGLWVDAKSPTRILWIYLLAMTLAGVVVATTTNVLHLFLGLTFLGLAASIYHPVGLAMLSLNVRQRAKAMSINGVAGNVGIAGGPALGYLCATMGMWRLAYAILAGLSLATLLVMQWVMRNHVVNAGGERSRVAGDAPPPEVAAPEPRSWRRYLPIFLLLCTMTFAGFNYRCLVVSLPAFISGDAKAVLHKTAGGLDALKVFGILIIGAVGQALGGWGITRFGARSYVFVILGLAPLALALAFLEGQVLAVAVACLFAMFLFSLQPIENCLLAEWTSKARRGVSYATKFAMTFGIGALGAPVVGYFARRYESVAPVMFCIAASGAVMLFLILFALRARRAAAIPPLSPAGRGVGGDGDLLLATNARPPLTPDPFPSSETAGKPGATESS